MVIPGDSRHVFASYLNSHGKRRWIVGQYVRQFEVESESDDTEFEYNEENDTYYIKEGWYEAVDNWDYGAYIAVANGTVDKWMEIPREDRPRTDGAPPNDHVD
jgi:hypothetical protein